MFNFVLFLLFSLRRSSSETSQVRPNVEQRDFKSLKKLPVAVQPFDRLLLFGAWKKIRKQKVKNKFKTAKKKSIPSHLCQSVDKRCSVLVFVLVRESEREREKGERGNFGFERRWVIFASLRKSRRRRERSSSNSWQVFKVWARDPSTTFPLTSTCCHPDPWGFSAPQTLQIRHLMPWTLLDQNFPSLSPGNSLKLSRHPGQVWGQSGLRTNNNNSSRNNNNSSNSFNHSRFRWRKNRPNFFPMLSRTCFWLRATLTVESCSKNGLRQLRHHRPILQCLRFPGTTFPSKRTLLPELLQRDPDPRPLLSKSTAKATNFRRKNWRESGSTARASTTDSSAKNSTRWTRPCSTPWKRRCRRHRRRQRSQPPLDRTSKRRRSRCRRRRLWGPRESSSLGSNRILICLRAT